MSEANNSADDRAKYRSDTITARGEEIKTFSAQLLVMTSTFLALSMLFVERFVGDKQGQTWWALCMAWGAWIICIVLVLLGHIISFHAFDSVIKQLESETPLSPAPAKKLNILVHALNWLALASFIVGLIAIVVFAAANL